MDNGANKLIDELTSGFPITIVPDYTLMKSLSISLGFNYAEQLSSKKFEISLE